MPGTELDALVAHARDLFKNKSNYHLAEEVIEQIGSIEALPYYQLLAEYYLDRYLKSKLTLSELYKHPRPEFAYQAELARKIALEIFELDHFQPSIWDDFREEDRNLARELPQFDPETLLQLEEACAKKMADIVQPDQESEYVVVVSPISLASFHSPGFA